MSVFFLEGTLEHAHAVRSGAEVTRVPTVHGGGTFLTAASVQTSDEVVRTREPDRRYSNRCDGFDPDNLPPAA